MKVIDSKNLTVQRSIDYFKDNSIGTIVRLQTDGDDVTYGVHIPRLMMGIDINNGAFDKTVTVGTGKCLNKVNKKLGDGDIILSNYIDLTMDRLYNISLPKYILGETVTVGIIDQDICSLFIKPYSRDQIRFRPNDEIELFAPASGKFDGDPLTDDNRYFVRLDSLHQNLRIHTSDAQGEIAQYDIKFDGAEGNLQLTDGNRNIILTTDDDEIMMNTEGGTLVTLKDDLFDVKTGTIFMEATDSINIKSPKGVVEIDNLEDVYKKRVTECDSDSIKGKTSKSDFKTIDVDATKISVKSPTTMFDGLVTITGYVCAGGIGFGAPPVMDPLPVNPAVDEKGCANFAGPTGVPLVKGPQLTGILSVFATAIDLALAKPPMSPPLPPIAVQSLTSVSGDLVTAVVKG